MGKLMVYGEACSGSTNYASAINCVDKDGNESTVQNELDKQNENLNEQLNGYKIKPIIAQVSFSGGTATFDTGIRSYTELYVLVSNYSAHHKISVTEKIDGVLSLVIAKYDGTFPTVDDEITFLCVYK